MISKTTIAKILDSAQIVDVISDFVSLRRRGANYTACCPFHNEKTPSFSVSPSKGIYKCFGCGKAGNAVNFVMEHEHLNYVEALKFLGRKYGIEVEEREESEAEIEQRLKSESLLVVSEFAKDFYVNSLWNSQKGRSVGLSYFKERGFTEEIVRKFQLGWAPEGRDGSMSSAALRAGYKKEFIISSGLGVEREQTGDLADRFYDRVMFPIHSLTGRIIAFGGRTLRTDKNIAKYINSPETEIYNKSRSLYGIYFAKSAIAKQQKCYLVEGYTDVISLFQAGIENVVASSGTSLTSEQVRLIRRFAPSVTILYDSDPAGIKASLRGIDMLLEEGLQVKVVLFPEGEDPDSYARGNSSAQLKEYLESSEKDFIEFKIELLSAEADKDPIKRRQLINEVVTSIAVIPDAITRAVYIEECSVKLRFDQNLLAREVNKLRKVRLPYGSYGKEIDTKESFPVAHIPDIDTGERLPLFIKNIYYEPAEKELLYYLLKFGEFPLYGIDDGALSPISVSQFILNELQTDELEFQNLLYKDMFEEYYKVRELSQDEIQKHFTNHTDPQIVTLTSSILIQEHSLNIKQFVASLIPEEKVLSIVVPKALMVYKAKITSIAYQDMWDQLKNTPAGDDERQTELMKNMQTLLAVRNMLSKELNRLTI
ncbi:MAG: DNA primase [Bacteroidales bacterium]|jgi:DNA primase|nr:DNA primase [Bacteroidales bacterium]MDD4057564.1 DNA primase [Bacteroidales bacterium]